MMAGQMRQLPGHQVQMLDLQIGHGLFPAGHDFTGDRAARGLIAEDARIDLQQFHGGLPVWEGDVQQATPWNGR